MMKTLRGFPLAPLGVLLAHATLSAAVVTLNPVADAFVTTGPSNTLTAKNYGGAGALVVSGSGSSKGQFQSVLSFNTSTAKSTFDSLYGPGLWSVQAVTLRLTAFGVNHPIFNANHSGSFAVGWMQNDAWTEGNGTPNAPGASGITYTTLQSAFINAGADEVLGAFSYNGSSNGTFTYTLTTPPGFAADLLAGNRVSLRLSPSDSAVSFLFNSRSYLTAGNRPLLSITAVPEPGLVALLAVGGLLAMTRRKRTPHGEGAGVSLR